MEKFNRKEFGDYQTPLFFTDTICEYLKNELKIMPEIIIEPTCGIGNFLKSASESLPYEELYGIDIDPAKLKEVDDVAYVRFASVYREFKDVNTFMDELKKMLDK